MAEDEPYDLMPHKEIVELKKQLQESKAKKEKYSSNDMLDSMDALTKSMDAMLKLFTEAAKELKIEEKENPINKKLDEIIDQNKIIAEGMVAISDTVNDFIEKQSQRGPSFQPGPRPSFPQPRFEPQFATRPQQQSFTTDLPDLDMPPTPQQGPVAMPSIPFTSLDMPPKPKKGGLFGRLKR